MWTPFTVRLPSSKTPRNTESMLIKRPLMRFKIQSRRIEAGGKMYEEEKKRRIKRESTAVGSLIFSLVDLQCAADLAGPLIACRCNNMD